MGALVSLDEALADRRLFRGGRPLARDQGATPSGFDALDAALPWGGFPRGALTEILAPAPGLGELELLLPALAGIGEKERIAFVAPPFVPYAPALMRAGLPLPRFAWIEAPAARAAWAAEQCLRAGCLGAVAFWLDQGDDKGLRRLQLAAEEGSAHAFVFRPSRQAANASPAALRLVLEAAPGWLRVRVLKVRGAVAPALALQRERVRPAGPVASSRNALSFEHPATVRGEPVEPSPHRLGSTSSPRTGEEARAARNALRFDRAATDRLGSTSSPRTGEAMCTVRNALSFEHSATVRGEPVEPLPHRVGSTSSPRTGEEAHAVRDASCFEPAR